MGLRPRATARGGGVASRLRLVHEGALGVAVVVLTYLYISSIVFLTGVQLDAPVNSRLDHGP